MGTRTIREKIETQVNFPMEFDMRPYLIGPQAKSEEPLMYRLYGVSNHIGGLGGGHYTAYARHGDSWHLFNDSSVSAATPEDIVSGEAYVLFYRLVKKEEADAEAAEASKREAGSGGGGGGGGGGGDSDADADVDADDVGADTKTADDSADSANAADGAV
jgi:ubiquitin carboxyl-terminal hydrolase 4/11/15